MIRDEIYYDNISQDLFSYVEVCPFNPELFKKDEYVPHYIRDFVEIANFCIKEDSYLLIFVHDEDDMRRYLSMLNDNYKDKFIFAYNRYFESVGHFKIVFDYKGHILIMKFHDSWSKYENLLGC